MQNLFSSASSAQDILAPGSYQLELVDIRPGKGRAFDNKPPKPTITFCFRELSSNAPVNRTVSATRDPRGRLIEFVRQLSGSKQPTQEQIANGEQFTAFLQSLIGKKFRASIAPSDNGRFNNIVSISPIEEAA
jgi:hypothetical protein